MSAVVVCTLLGLASPPPTAATQRTAAPPLDLRLVDATQRKDAEAVRSLLNERVDIDTPHADGATALAWAVHWDALDIASLLIGAGANVNAANELGVTPLMLACINGSAPMVDALLQAGADPAVARVTGETPLMIASRTGNAAVVRLLVAGGADVNAATTGGHTALMWAAAERHADIVRVLAEVGADVHARTAVQTRAARPGGYARKEPVVLSRFEAVNPAGLSGFPNAETLNLTMSYVDVGLIGHRVQTRKGPV